MDFACFFHDCCTNVTIIVKRLCWSWASKNLHHSFAVQGLEPPEAHRIAAYAIYNTLVHTSWLNMAEIDINKQSGQ